MDAIVLAGGLGTRLAPLTDTVPKPMVEVAGKPFLEYLLASLAHQQIELAVLAVSYKWEVIRDHFGDTFQGMELDYSIENNPLGTGGGVKKALTKTHSRQVIVFNGDTYFQVPVQQLLKLHIEGNTHVTLALKPMMDCSRYGTVNLEDERVVGFQEKGTAQSGYINGGVTVIDRDIFDKFTFPESFSFERDLLAAHVTELKVGGFVADGFFIDIGVQEDLERAQTDLPKAVGSGKHAAHAAIEG